MAAPNVICETGRFRIELQSTPPSFTIKPIGWMDEDSDLNQAFKILTQSYPDLKIVTVDLGRITQVNSCGVREWIIFLELLQKRYSIRFLNVNESFIEQASIIPSMLGKPESKIVSFHAPYFCLKCKNRVVKVLAPADVKIDQKTFQAPETLCAECKTPMEFDSLEEEYLQFIKRASL